MSLDRLFNRLKTKENRSLDSRGLEQVGILGSYLLPKSMLGKMEPPPGLKAEFRTAEDLLNQGSDEPGSISDETREQLRDIVNRIRATYRLY
jgi:hypothetical protein